MRRIVHYYPDAMGNSGVTHALWTWARAQAASGAEVCVLHAPSSQPTTAASFVSKDLGPGLVEKSVSHRGRHRLARWPVGLDRYLGRNDLLVLHEGWVPSNLVAAAAARRACVPYVVMPHGVYEPAWTEYLKPPLSLRRRLERGLLERAAAVHVFFDSEIAVVRSLAPCASFMTIPTGFDLPEERWTGGGGYLAWVGRIDPINKGLDVLARAIARLDPDERPVVRIQGYDYKGGIACLRRIIDELAVREWVHLDGAIAGAEKTRFLQHGDGYLLPSRWECHSLALLENLALGVPCLVSSVIHIARTLDRTGAAVLAPPSDTELAYALGRLTAAGRDIAGRGRALVREAFNWTTLLPRFHAALGSLGLQ
ncbi:MAG TPA: glycosyltransferase [Vicinamibacterales bacterium]|jgi:glycosyltransferase involved in cell wall biosynthesis|nr:glycosyltransferase [Vicinamibacterales bacterium]